jgi:hypothetical protein
LHPAPQPFGDGHGFGSRVVHAQRAQPATLRVSGRIRCIRMPVPACCRQLSTPHEVVP